MAAPNITQRPRRLTSFMASFIVIGLVGLCPAAMAQDSNAHNEAVAALADIDSAIGELRKSSDLTANTEGPYKQSAQRAAAGIAGALGHLDWLAEHAGANVWGPDVEGSVVNLQIAKGHLDNATRTDGLEEFWSDASSALQALLIAAGRESSVGVLGGLRGALATTKLGVPGNVSIVSGCSLPARAPAYGIVDGYLTYIVIPHSGAADFQHPLGITKVSFATGYIILHTAASDLISRSCPAGQTTTATFDSPGNKQPAR